MERLTAYPDNIYPMGNPGRAQFPQLKLMCPVNDFSYHCWNRFFATGSALAMVLLSLNKLWFNTICLFSIFSNLSLALIHSFCMEREWSHVLLLLRIEDNYPHVWRHSSDTQPLNLDAYPKLLKICRGLRICSWLSKLPKI